MALTTNERLTATVWVRITAPTQVGAQSVGVGEVLEVSRDDARDLICGAKAEYLQPPAKRKRKLSPFMQHVFGRRL